MYVCASVRECINVFSFLLVVLETLQTIAGRVGMFVLARKQISECLCKSTVFKAIDVRNVFEISIILKCKRSSNVTQNYGIV